jgi:hypothetical protein
VLKESFEESQARIRRILESVGGSADAYDAQPAKPPVREGKPTWDQVCQMSKLTDPTPSAGPKSPVDGFREGTSEPASDEPTDEELNAFIKEQMSDAAKPAAPESCGTDLEEYFGIGEAPEPIGPEYHLAGHSSDMGELESVYMAFALSNVSEEAEEVQLASGTTKLEKFGPNWGLLDRKKGLRYLKEDISVHHAEVEPEDTFIWVLPLGPSGVEDFGYIHRGWVYLRK